MAQKPEILELQVNGESFLDAIMKPHKGYYQSLKGLFSVPELVGMAHITGGGIQGNLNRILPKQVDAVIDLLKIRILPIFRAIREMGSVEDADMLRTFNMGVGMTIVVRKAAVERIIEHLAGQNCDSYVIGEIAKGKGQVIFNGKLDWGS
jgi:phosphoribosylformylglycinamidine cyclo-ligase